MKRNQKKRSRIIRFFIWFFKLIKTCYKLYKQLFKGIIREFSYSKPILKRMILGILLLYLFTELLILLNQKYGHPLTIVFSLIFFLFIMVLILFKQVNGIIAHNKIIFYINENIIENDKK